MAAKKAASHKKASTKAGRFVKTEMHHKAEGKHSAKHPIKSRKQAIAIGLNKARKAGHRIPKTGKSASK